MLIVALPITGDYLEKARRSIRLVRKVRTVTRDGATFQQAYWVLPSEQDAEDMPRGAQLDLFDQAPETRPAVRPSLFSILDGVDEGRIDKFTRDSRAMAARLADYVAQYPTWQEWLNYRRGLNSMESRTPDAYDDAVELWETNPPNLSTRSYNLLSVPWERLPDFYRAMAKGYIGVDATDHERRKRRRAKAKWEALKPDDFARFDLQVKLEHGILEKDRQARKQQGDTFEAEALESDLMGKKRPYFNYRITDNTEKAWRIVDGFESAPYEIGRRKFILKAKEQPRAVKPPVDASDPVEAVKALAARGVKTYEDAMAIGEIVYKAAVSHEHDEELKALDALKNRLLATHETIKSYRSHLERGGREIKLFEKMLASGLSQFNQPLDKDNRRYYEGHLKEIVDRQTKYEIALKTIFDENIELSEKHDKMLDAMKDIPGKEKSILDFLAKVRPMGPGSLKFDQAQYHVGNLKSAQMKATVREAMSVFPTAWLEKLEAKGKAVVFKNTVQGKGSCSGYTIKAPWGPGMINHSKSTQAHEIGHAIESANGLAELCRQFVYSLVDESNSGRVKTNKTAMRNWQKGLQSDNLPSQYAGVLYDHGSTEVMSMAAGYLFSDYDRALSRQGKHEKYWHFILGLWAGA